MISNESTAAPWAVQPAMTAADGTPIRAWRWSTPAAVGACLVGVHGLGDHACSLGMARFAQAMAARGHGVWTFDLRGHGTVPARERGIAAWSGLLDDLHGVVAGVRAASDRPLLIAGISLGALLALELQSAPPAGVVGVAGAAAPLAPVRAAWLARIAARCLGRAFPRLPLHTGIDLDAVASNTEAARAWRADARVHTRVAAGLAAAALDAPRRLMAAAPRARLPLLLQHGLDDRLADWDPRFASAFAADACTVRTYAGARHNLHLEHCAAQVFADLAGWIDACIAGAGPGAADGLRRG